MSNTVGYVLLGSAVVPGLFGWDLSRRGLAKVNQAADQATRVAKEAHATVKEAHATIADASGQEAATVAKKASEVVDKTDALTSGIGDVSDALKTMTGVFAPARVFLALTFLLVLAAIAALDVVSLSGGTS
jgi:hypothetical protein